MNKLTKFCKDALMNFYKIRMDGYLEESMEASWKGDHARGTFMYGRYLSYKRKYEKLANKK